MACLNVLQGWGAQETLWKKKISQVLEQIGFLQHNTQVCITHLLDRGGPLLDDSALCTSKILPCENLMALNTA